MAGQCCLGADNLLLVVDADDVVKEKFVVASAVMKLGYGLNTETELGPLVSGTGRKKILNFLERAEKDGAKVILDGRNVNIQGF